MPLLYIYVGARFETMVETVAFRNPGECSILVQKLCTDPCECGIKFSAAFLASCGLGGRGAG